MELTYIRGVLLIITSSVIAFLLCNSSIVFQAEISFWVLSVLLANNKYTNRKIFAIGTINTNNHRPDNEISRNLFIHCARKKKLTDIYHTVDKDAFAGDGIVLKRGKKKFKKICVK